MTEYSREDMRGELIKVGSVVVYPGRAGSNLWLNEAIVEEVHPRLMVRPMVVTNVVDDFEVRKPSARVVEIKRTNRVAVVR